MGRAKKIVIGVAAYTVATYLIDGVLRPEIVARRARKYADSVGKPLLNIGAGQAKSSFRAVLFGPTRWGDVNIDLAAPKTDPCGRELICWGDAHDLKQYPDKHFGAIVATHLLEHLERPKDALREWNRVADKLFIVTPKWWAVHTWAHPDHKWFIPRDGEGEPVKLWDPRISNALRRAQGWGALRGIRRMQRARR